VSGGELERKIREILTVEMEDLDSGKFRADLPQRDSFTKVLEVVALAKADYLRITQAWEENYGIGGDCYDAILTINREGWFEKWFGSQEGKGFC